jgi:hypothetical protein
MSARSVSAAMRASFSAALMFLIFALAIAGSAAWRSSGRVRRARRRVSGARLRRPAGVVPDGERVGLGHVGRHRAAQDLVPATEAHQRVERQHRIVLQDRGAAVARTWSAGRRPGRVGGLDGEARLPGHRRCRVEKMVVVGDVADAVRALCIDGGEIAPVRFDRLLVGEDGVGVAASPQVDVRRHVREVARAGTRSRSRSALGSPSRDASRTLQVDPVVMRAGMVRNQRHRAGELGDDLRRPGLCRAVGLPPVVGMQVQHRFGGEGRDFAVLREALRQRGHRPGVARLVDAAGGRMADRQRPDQTALRRRRPGGVRARLLECGAHALGSGGPMSLDVGSCDQASAHQQVAQRGSMAVAAANERAASAGLNP